MNRFIKKNEIELVILLFLNKPIEPDFFMLGYTGL